MKNTLIAGMLTFAAAISSVQSAGPSSVFLTLSPNQKTSGPVYKSDQTKYGNEVAKIIIQEAHKRAKHYLDYNTKEFNQAYYAFMVLALTVPRHEGFYVQFRETSPSECSDKRNLLQVAQERGNKTAVKNYNQYLRNPANPYITTCNQVLNKKTINQIIAGGHDNTDIGMFQLSMRWHFANFLANDFYKDVRETIRYGTAYLMYGDRAMQVSRAGVVPASGGGNNGFDGLLTTHQKHDCISKGKDNEKVDFKNLIRGTWARYNQGWSGKKARKTEILCRFQQKKLKDGSDNKYDLGNGFISSLDATLKLDSSTTFGSIAPAKISGNVKDAVAQIIKNFKKGKNKRKDIEKIL